MSDTLLIDSDILIDSTRGDENALRYLHQQEQQKILAVSVMSEMELRVGCQNKQESSRLDRSLEFFQLIQLDRVISQRAAELVRIYNLSHGLLIPDALIAATALELNISLATRNRKDFRFIDGLKLARYSR